MRCIVYSATYECDIGPHVFPTRKYRLVLEQLLASGVVTRDQVLEPTPIDRASLEYVHTRAAIIDTDVHQGNGTARIFQDDARVWTFSIHQENNYPIKERSDHDIGLDDGTGDEPYLAALDTAMPVALDTRPDLVLMVAGVDPYKEDQLGGLALTLEGLEARDRLVVNACGRAGVPLVGLTAGGYARRTADTVTAHVNTTRAVLAWRP